MFQMFTLWFFINHAYKGYLNHWLFVKALCILRNPMIYLSLSPIYPAFEWNCHCCSLFCLFFFSFCLIINIVLGYICLQYRVTSVMSLFFTNNFQNSIFLSCWVIQIVKSRLILKFKQMRGKLFRKFENPSFGD